MALAKRGLRRITVGSVEYLWKVRSHPTYNQGQLGNNLTAAVELAKSPGSVLSITFPWLQCDNWIGSPETPVTPRDIEACIKAALSQGWRPEIKGSAFKYVHEAKT